MKILRQIYTVSWLNIKNIPSRLGLSLVAIAGAAGVVAVLVAVLALSEGFSNTMEAAGQDDHALILRSGANTELSSGLWRNVIEVIRTAPGIAKSGEHALVAPQLVAILDVPRQSTNTIANVPLRGVTQDIYQILSDFEIIEGRKPVLGTKELIVGRAVASEFGGMEVGNTLGSGVNTWKVVGIFTDNGSVRESEVWADLIVVQDTFRRGNSYNSVLVQLESPESLALLTKYLDNDPRVWVTVQRETDYYATQAEALKTFISVLGYSVVFLMAIGAVFAALNSMYSTISSRSREIAILRTLGFGTFPLLVSVLIEAILLTLLGGALGATAVYFLFNEVTVSTLNLTSFSQVAFAFSVSPNILITGFSGAILIGFLGGLFPALRAVRIPVTRVLSDL